MIFYKMNEHLYHLVCFNILISCIASMASKVYLKLIMNIEHNTY